MVATKNQPHPQNERHSRMLGFTLLLGVAAFALAPLASADHIYVPTPVGSASAHHDGATGVQAGADLAASTGMAPVPLPVAAGASGSLSLAASEQGVSASASPSIYAADQGASASASANASADGSGSAEAKALGLIDAAVKWFTGLF